jgi:hypothetical protein
MDVHCHQVAIVVVLVLLASASEEAIAIRSPGTLAPWSSPSSVSPAEQPRGRIDAPEKVPTEASGPSPLAVFGLERKSKRRVRSGSDPIHNKC